MDKRALHFSTTDRFSSPEWACLGERICKELPYSLSVGMGVADSAPAPIYTTSSLISKDLPELAVCQCRTDYKAPFKCCVQRKAALHVDVKVHDLVILNVYSRRNQAKRCTNYECLFTIIFYLK